MKNSIFLALIFTLALSFISCEALPFNYSTGQSWLIDENLSGEKWAGLELLYVKAEKSGGWDYVEKEAALLAPLYFWNEGRKVVPGEEKPVYAAGIHLREREFYLGWRTKRSISAEVRIWVREDAAIGAPEGEASFYEKKLPIAAGRVVTVGDKSFSSSNTTGKMLSNAVKKAVKELSVHEKKNDA